jgi:hypothetical protein
MSFHFGGGGGPPPPLPPPVPPPPNPPILGQQALKPQGSNIKDPLAGFAGTVLGSDAGLDVSGKTLLGQ